MKTICFVVPDFPSVSETFVVNQMIAAKNRGFNVQVLTHRLGSLEQSSQKELLEAHDLLKDTLMINYHIPETKWKQLLLGGILAVRFFKYWRQSFKGTLRHGLLNRPYLIRFYRKLQGIDVFHVQFASGGIGLAEMKEAGLIKGKIITTFHGHDAHVKNANELNHLKRIYKTLFQESEHVTVNTPYLEDKVLALGCKRERIHVIPMGVDLGYFKGEIGKELPLKGAVRLISVGRFIEFKGFNYAIQAVKLLIDQGVEVVYTIVGDGPLDISLRQQIEALGLKDKVKLEGRLSQQEIKKELETHHLYLMCSITDSKGRCETQGVVTAEAQAMGLPVVAFNNGGIPYTIQDGETGRLVKEKDAEAYAQAILTFLEQQSLYKKMSLKARDFAMTNFSLELMTERFINLYKN
ncbi:glycosyltransferase [Mangrovimonas sp. ST2L15]|uniref:glycosyltransferase n=1 Tax=Mangrovimonas sp. ST2L15 TaxID=1645916 RepID=UPI0006B6998C|nr:glycosyltransferase [Mangrovimonas sp. ST2L15]